MKKTLLIAALFLAVKASAQEEILSLTLSQAIEIAQEHSPEAEAARHTYRSAYWSYRFYKANYLPSVTLTSSPSFNKQISKVTQPDGTNLFIKQNQLAVDLDLKINQNVWFTGGSLFVRSNVQRMDHGHGYGDERRRYERTESLPDGSAATAGRTGSGCRSCSGRLEVLLRCGCCRKVLSRMRGEEARTQACGWLDV